MSTMCNQWFESYEHDKIRYLLTQYGSHNSEQHNRMKYYQKKVKYDTVNQLIFASNLFSRLLRVEK